MSGSLDAAAFLTRSENRVDALTALADEPMTRTELLDATGMSQVTLGRVLAGLSERRWIETVDEVGTSDDDAAGSPGESAAVDTSSSAGPAARGAGGTTHGAGGETHGAGGETNGAGDGTHDAGDGTHDAGDEPHGAGDETHDAGGTAGATVYRITSAGRVVASALDSFLDSLDSAETLASFVHWLPVEEYDFDLERLGDATVIRPDPTDPNATMRTAARQIAGSAEVRILTHGFSTLVLHELYRGATDGSMRIEGVFAAEVFDAMHAAPETTAEFDALLEHDDAAFYRFEGGVPHILAVFDDGVGIGVTDDQGAPRAVLDVADPVVREWANETIDRYRDAAAVVDDPAELS